MTHDMLIQLFEINRLRDKIIFGLLLALRDAPIRISLYMGDCALSNLVQTESVQFALISLSVINQKLKNNNNKIIFYPITYILL